MSVSRRIIPLALLCGAGTLNAATPNRIEQIIVSGLHDIHRVDAVGGNTTGVAGHDLAGLGKSGNADRRNNDAVHAGRQRLRMHRRPIGVKLGRIEMAVGVDHPPRKGKTGAGFRPLIRSVRAAAEPQASVQPSVPWPVLSQRLS